MSRRLNFGVVSFEGLLDEGGQVQLTIRGQAEEAFLLSLSTTEAQSLARFLVDLAKSGAGAEPASHFIGAWK